jgi:hypothetical protein
MRSSNISAKSFTPPPHTISFKGGKTVLIMRKTLLKNNLNFVKEINMIYTNFIIILTIVSGKKYRQYICTTPDNLLNSMMVDPKTQ